MDKMWKIAGLVLALLVVTSGVVGVVSAKPSAKLTPNNWDITVNQGDTFTVTFTAENTGSTPNDKGWSHITISVEKGLDIVDWTSWSSNDINPQPGKDKIWHEEGYEFTAKEEMLEAYSSFPSGTIKKMKVTFKVKPDVSEMQLIMARFTIMDFTEDTNWGTANYYRDPAPEVSTITDQQGHKAIPIWVHVKKPTKPSPKIIKVDYPSSITLGEWAEIKVKVKNKGEKASWQTISISFPQNSKNVDIVSDDVDSSEVFWPGKEEVCGYGSYRCKLKYPMAEGWSEPWPAGENGYLKVKVKPEKEGDFKFYVKSVAGRQPDGKCYSWDPKSGTKDQQDEYANIYTIKVQSSLRVDVKNTAGYNLPSCGGNIKVKLWDKNNNYLKTESKTYSGGESSVQVTFDNLANGDYYIEVSQTPNAGLKLEEFWGGKRLTVSGTTTTTFERHTQWLSNITINKQSPYNNDIEVNVGDTVHVDLTVKNDEATSKYVKARLILDRSKSSPYDFDWTAGPVNIASNRKDYFGFDYIPDSPGNYYFAVVVYGYYNNKYTVVDQHDWHMGFEQEKINYSSIAQFMSNSTVFYRGYTDKWFNPDWWDELSADTATETASESLRDTISAPLKSMAEQLLVPEYLQGSFGVVSLAMGLMQTTESTVSLFEAMAYSTIGNYIRCGNLECDILTDLKYLKANSVNIKVAAGNGNEKTLKELLTERKSLLEDLYRKLSDYDRKVYEEATRARLIFDFTIPSSFVNYNAYGTIKSLVMTLHLQLQEDYIFTTYQLERINGRDGFRKLNLIIDEGHIDPTRFDKSQFSSVIFGCIDEKDEINKFRINLVANEVGSDKKLYVTLPARPLGKDNVNGIPMYIKYGNEPTTSDYDYKSDTSNRIIIENPKEGSYYLLLKAENAPGMYRLETYVNEPWMKIFNLNHKVDIEPIGGVEFKQYPKPKIVDIQIDKNEISIGEEDTLTVKVTNNGGFASWQSIAVSSPNITNIDSYTILSHNLDYFEKYEAGYKAGSNYGTEFKELEYPLIEGTKKDWVKGFNGEVKLKIKPEQTGNLKIYIKSVAFGEGVWQSDPAISASLPFDQQGEFVYVREIVVDELTSIDVKPDSWTMDINDEKQFSATATYKSGNTEDVTAKATWSSSDTSVLQYLDSGKFRALKEGSATVTAIYKGKSDSSDVTIYPITHFYTFQTTDNAMKITIDGSAYNSPHTEQWKDGETHEISVPPEQAIVRDKSKYVFTHWSGKSSSTSTSLQITAGSTTAGTYTANYKTQYYLTVNTEPEGLTTISGSGWYDAGSTATTGKAPDNVGEYEFSTWKVDGNPVSGNPISVTMNDAHTATACYVPIGKPDLTLSPSDITFPNPYPTEGDIVKIIATIHNIGNKEAISANVKFYDGDPDNGGVQIDATQSLSSIPPSGTKDASVDWNTTGKGGEHTIYVVIADCSPEEASTEYNEASKDIIIGRYGVDLSCANPEKSIPSGGYAVYNIAVKNTGNVEDTIKVTTSLPPLLPTRLPWAYSLDKYSVELSPGESTEVVLTVSDISDKGLPAGSSCEVEVTGISQGDPTKSDSVLTKTTVGDWNPWNDSGSDGRESIITAELQEAIHCWLNDEPAPKTGAEITTARLQEVIHQWLVG